MVVPNRMDSDLARGGVTVSASGEGGILLGLLTCEKTVRDWTRVL